MSSDYEKLRRLLLDQEQSRIQTLQADLSQTRESVPDLVARDIESGLKEGTQSRLARALNEVTLNGLEHAVKRRPETVVDALFPVIGPAIRRALQEAMRQLSADIDRAVNNAFSARAWTWRLEAWRSGVPYAQVVLRNTVGWRVEHLFLVHPESGLLLGQLTAPELPELDADAIAGMFTAIQSFVSDSMQATTQNGEGGIGFATIGDYQLVVSEGPQARLVAFVRGVPGSDFPTRLDELNEILHAQKSTRLADSAGVAGPGLLEPAQLDALNVRQETLPAGSSRMAGYLFLEWRHSSRACWRGVACRTGARSRNVCAGTRRYRRSTPIWPGSRAFSSHGSMPAHRGNWPCKACVIRWRPTYRRGFPGIIPIRRRTGICVPSFPWSRR